MYTYVYVCIRMYRRNCSYWSSPASPNIITCVCVRVCVCARMRECVSISVCLSVCRYSPASPNIITCVCVCLSVCVCARAHA